MQDRPQGAREAVGYGWFVVGVLCFLNFTSAIDQFMMAIVIVPLKADLRLSDTQLGLLTGLGFGLLYCLAGIPFGRIADLVSRRWMLFWGCLAWSLATAACAFAQSFGALFVTRVVVGLAEATLMPGAVSLIAAYVARERLGLANGLFMMGASAGKASAFLLGGWILSLLLVGGGMTMAEAAFKPWQALFLFAALPGILAAALMLMVREPMRSVRSLAGGAMGELAGHVGRHAVGIGSFVATGACSVLIAVLYAAWTPSFFVRRFDLSVGRASLIVGLVVAAVGPLGSVLGGVANDALARRGIGASPLRVVVAAILIAIPTTALMVLSTSMPLAIAGYAGAQFVIMMGSPQSFAGMQMLTPVRHRGLVSATYLAVATFASLGLGPVSIGLFSDRLFTDHATGLGYALLSVVTLFGLLGTLLGAIAAPRFERTVSAAAALTNAAEPGAAVMRTRDAQREPTLVPAEPPVLS